MKNGVHRGAVSTRGRVTIAAAIRNSLCIEPGTCVTFELKGGIIKARPITEAYLDSIQGVLQPNSDGESWSEELVREHAEETAG